MKKEEFKEWYKLLKEMKEQGINIKGLTNELIKNGDPDY